MASGFADLPLPFLYVPQAEGLPMETIVRCTGLTEQQIAGL